MTPNFHQRLKVVACAATALTLAAFTTPMALSQATDQDSETITAPVTAPVTTDQSEDQTSDTLRATDQIILEPGTVIPVLLNRALTSNTSRDGDTFAAKVDTSREAYNSLMRGATVEGIVRHAKAQSGSDPGTLELAFTRLRLPNGESYPISGTVASLDTKDLQVRSDGVLQAVKTNKDQSLAYAGIGAGAGAVIGILSGGKIRIEDLLLGGGLGYAAGQLLKNTQQVHDVDLKAGTPVGVLLNKRVLYHRHTLTTMAPGTAARTHVLATPRSAAASKVRYYSYQGHPYSLDLNTGKRTKLD